MRFGDDDPPIAARQRQPDLLSRAQVSVELDAGVLIARELASGFSRNIGITTRAGWRPTSTQEAFLAMLRDCGRKQAQQVCKNL
jgi:hypothetical protein